MKLIKNIFQKSKARYLQNQARDIEKYHKKFILRNKDVPECLVDEITPFRRLSEKPSNLSDKTWFIRNYEEQKGKEYLPKYWEEYSEQEKADYIVTKRYSSLVAHKIMNKIKDEPVEHSYRLYKGEITGYAVGDEQSVKNVMSLADTRVHNHPIGAKIKNIKTKYIRNFLESLCPDLYTSKCGFSGQDIWGTTVMRETSFVIDSNNHKFMFEPKLNPTSLDEQLKSALSVKKLIAKNDEESSNAQTRAFATLIGKILAKSGHTSEKYINEGAEFFQKYGSLLVRPFLGMYRDSLFRSEIFKTKLLDKVGRYKEL